MNAPVDTFDFIVNRRGGTVLEIGEEKTREEVLARFGDRAGDFTFVEGKDVAAAVKAWAAVNAGKNRALMIGGGDGTLVTAVEQVLGREDIILGTLPLGTHNLIARQLGFAADFRAAAAQYKSCKTTEMDVGKVNGMHFLIGILLDKNSVRYYSAREEMRDKKRIGALKNIFALSANLFIGFKERFTVSERPGGQNEKTFKGKVVAVMNNRIKPRPVFEAPPGGGGAVKGMVANILAKEPEATGKLALYAFNGLTYRSALSAPRFLRGTWDESKSRKAETTAHFFIQGADAVAGEETTFVLDGEIKKTQYPLDVSIISKGLRIFTPS